MEQIIPCNVEMYAIYNCKGETIRSRVLAFGLNELGYTHPMAFNSEVGLVDTELMDAVKYECVKNDRIADALESIVRRLDNLDELPETLQRINDCVGEYPPSKFSPPGTPGASFIRIGGTAYGE